MNTKKITEGELTRKGFVRGYHRHSKAWYEKAQTLRSMNPTISFGMYGKESGCFAEMTAEWITLRSGLTPRINTFDDGWALYGIFSDLFEKLGEYHGKNVSEEEFSTILDWFGFKDLTQYENPRESLAEKERIQTKEAQRETISAGA